MWTYCLGRAFLTFILLASAIPSTAKQDASTICSYLQLQSTAPKSIIAGKSSLKYTVTLTNKGRVAIDNYIVSLAIPTGVNFVQAKVYPHTKAVKASTSPQSGGSVVFYEVPTIPAGKKVKIIYEFNIGSCLSSATDVRFVASGYQVLDGGIIQCEKMAPTQTVMY